MEDASTFARTLEERLEARRDFLDRAELPRLRDAWKLFQSSFQGLHAVLSKKGIVHEDPYKYELKISEVVNPPEGPFAESEKADQMSLRLSQFDSYLDFLNNYYQFSCDFLTMGRIKRLLGLVKYFNFLQFTATSTNLNTRCLAELADLVRKGSDQLSSGLIGESVGQLERASKDILGLLKEVAAWHRERWKLELRQLVMPSLALESGWALTHREEAARLARRKFLEVAGDRPFYPELVDEIISEDHSSDAQGLRDEILRRLEVREEVKVTKAQEKSYRAIILEGLRGLAGAAYQVEDALAKLAENSALLSSLDSGFMSRLRLMVRRLFSPEAGAIRYLIEIADPVTGERREEELDFPAFMEEWGRKAKSLASLLQRGGTSWRRLEAAPEDQSYKFLERNIEELQRLVRRLAALDEFFKSSLPQEERSRLRGVKAEITTIKGALIKANQKKHEYVAQREEREQMKRLGIKGD